jgi:hypothetical protein
MTLGARRTLVALILTVVVLAVIGLLYLETIAQRNATRPGWLVTQPVQAGDSFNRNNVKEVNVAASNDTYTILTSDPTNKHAARNLPGQTLLRPDDVTSAETTEVPITLRANPPLSRGDTIDVYAYYRNQAIRVGTRLTVVNASNPVVVQVPAADEAAWLALLATDTPLYAAKSPGVSVGGQNPTGPTDAIQQLSGAQITTATVPSPSP